MLLPEAVSPVVVGVPGLGPTWGTEVRLGDDYIDWWEDQHPHRGRLTGPVMVDGVWLLVPVDHHGVLVVRAIGTEDTWLVFPANRSAWEADQRGQR